MSCPQSPSPSYLRVVVTARCSLACSYCHQEGDPASAVVSALAPGRLPRNQQNAPNLAPRRMDDAGVGGGRPQAASGGEGAGEAPTPPAVGGSRGLPTDELAALLATAVGGGVRKLKFLGGEPLLRADLPEQIRRLRALDPSLDISLITAGAVDPQRLRACFQAGLSRANLSIHGWGPAAFAERTGRGERARGLRDACLALLLEEGRFLKLNFVWRGPQDDEDLGALLEHVAGLPVVVGVLDDLGEASLGPAAVIEALGRLRGPPAQALPEPDPHSLPTLRLRWGDGLEVEVKDHHLGEQAPWKSCLSCPVRAACREGIHALRLTHEGRLRPCMDRPDIGLDLREAWRMGGATLAATSWRVAVRSWARPASVRVPPCPDRPSAAPRAPELHP